MLDQDRRAAAIKRLHAKRGFQIHAAAYVVGSLAMLGIWALTDTPYFWPVWPIGGWAIGLFFHGWGIYGIKPLSEDAIRREMERGA